MVFFLVTGKNIEKEDKKGIGVAFVSDIYWFWDKTFDVIWD